MPVTPRPSDSQDPRKSSTFAPVAPAPLGSIEAPWDEQERKEKEARAREAMKLVMNESRLRATAARKVLTAAAKARPKDIPYEALLEAKYTEYRARILDQVVFEEWEPKNSAPNPKAFMEHGVDGKWVIRANGAWTRGKAATFDTVEAALSALCSPGDVRYLAAKLSALQGRAWNPETRAWTPGLGYTGVCVVRPSQAAAPAKNQLPETVETLSRRCEKLVAGLLEIGGRFIKGEKPRDWSGARDSDALAKAPEELSSILRELKDAAKPTAAPLTDWGGDAVVLNLITTDSGFAVSAAQFESTWFSATFNPYTLRSLEVDDFSAAKDPLPLSAFGAAKILGDLRKDAEPAVAQAAADLASINWKFLALLEEGAVVFNAHARQIVKNKDANASVERWIPISFSRPYLKAINGTDESAAPVDLPMAQDKASRGESYLPDIYDAENLEAASVLVDRLHNHGLSEYVHLFKTLAKYSVKYWTKIVASEPRDLEFRQGQDIGPFEKALLQGRKVFTAPVTGVKSASPATASVARYRRSVSGFFPPQKAE